MLRSHSSPASFGFSSPQDSPWADHVFCSLAEETWRGAQEQIVLHQQVSMSLCTCHSPLNCPSPALSFLGLVPVSLRRRHPEN